MTPIKRLVRRDNKIFIEDYTGKENLVAESPTRAQASWVVFGLGSHHGVSTAEYDEDE
jgi:hypothetical protein